MHAVPDAALQSLHLIHLVDNATLLVSIVQQMRAWLATIMLSGAEKQTVHMCRDVKIPVVAAVHTCLSVLQGFTGAACGIFCSALSIRSENG